MERAFFLCVCVCGGQFLVNLLLPRECVAALTRPKQLLVILLCGFSVLYPHMAVIYILLTAGFFVRM